MPRRALVLNVDDDQAGRYAVGRTLNQAGWEVVDGRLGSDVLRLVDEIRPDVLLLDVRLSDPDRFEVCRRIRADPKTSATPIIQLSPSFIDTRSKVNGSEIGADAYLTEPVDPEILIATIRSVLRIKESEQKVRETATQWRATFDAISDGVVLLDRVGNPVRCNQAFERLVNDDPTAFWEAVNDGLHALRHGAERETSELAFDDKTLSLSLDPIRMEQAFDGAVCVVSDITERKRFEAELRRTARLESIALLAGFVAHDFSNLLTGIIGNVSLVQESMPEGSEDRELLREVLQASQSAAVLTQQLLAHSGKGQSLKTSVNLSALALDSRAFVRRFIPANVEFTVDTDPRIPPVHADASQMIQVLMNLVINAAESFDPKARGTVTLKTKVEHLGSPFFAAGEKNLPGDYVLVTVTDSGSGMSEETQKHIFDPFFTTKLSGRGLGLSAVYGIIKGHSGLLRLDSRIGKGTTFSVYFPVSDAEYTDRAKPMVLDRAHGTILFIDDEPLVRNFARVALQKRGYEVLLRENWPAAIEMFRQSRDRISLVILDCASPAMKGEQAFAQLRHLSPDMPVLLSSAFSESVPADKFSSKGFAGFLAKPYSAAQMAEAVEIALQTRTRTA